MWPSEWLPVESESPRLLAQCLGVRGQAWCYSASHSQMLVRFYDPGSLAGIYLYCKGCERVQFQSCWDEADPRIKISHGEHGPVYTISDGDRLHIACGAAFLVATSDLVTLNDSNL